MPLDHADPAGEHITVFAREVVAPRKRDQELPWLLFLSGGPGARGPRPLNRSGWLGRALADHRVLLLDIRGTGRSTPATRQSLPRRGDTAAQARYLTHFRADSIVRDAELLRTGLVGQDARWSLLGQSYGGFVALTYLSLGRRLAGQGADRGRPATAGPRPGRGVPGHLRAGPAAVRATGRAVPRRRGPVRRDRRPRRHPRRPAPGRRPADGAAAAVARLRAGLLGRHGEAALPDRVRVGRGRAGRRLPGRRRDGHHVHRPAAVRTHARVDLLPGRRVGLVGRPGGRGTARVRSRGSSAAPDR